MKLKNCQLRIETDSFCFLKRTVFSAFEFFKKEECCYRCYNFTDRERNPHADRSEDADFGENKAQRNSDDELS